MGKPTVSPEEMGTVGGSVVHHDFEGEFENFQEEFGWMDGNRSLQIGVRVIKFAGPEVVSLIPSMLIPVESPNFDTPEYQFYKKMKFLLDLFPTFLKKSTFP